MAPSDQMFGSNMQGEHSLHLHSAPNRITATQDSTSHGGNWRSRTACTLAGFMLMGVAAWATDPSHATTQSVSVTHAGFGNSFLVMPLVHPMAGAYPMPRQQRAPNSDLRMTDNKEPMRSEDKEGWRGAGPGSDPLAVLANDRRKVVIGLSTLLAPVVFPSSVQAADGDVLTAEAFNVLERTAKQSYLDKDLATANDALSKIIRAEPLDPLWRERRAQVLVDMKRFEEAIEDYAVAEKYNEEKYGAKYRSLGMLANRALAYEGLAKWEDAVKDYSEAIKYSAIVGGAPPYVLNSRGNCYVSLAKYDLAFNDYSAAADTFRRARDLNGQNSAMSNAALMKAELGDLDGAIKSMEGTSRRAMGNVDMKAALAAMYYARGDREQAEKSWNGACDGMRATGCGVSGGPCGDAVLDACATYLDYDWLGRIRRWPPSMVQKFKSFIKLESVA